MKKTIGTRVGYLYDMLADPTFTGPAAESVMKEYIGLTRHPTDADLAYFAVNKTNGRSTLSTLIIVGGSVLVFVLWLRLLNKALKHNQESQKNFQEIRRKLIDLMLDIKKDHPEFELPEDLFDGTE